MMEPIMRTIMRIAERVRDRATDESPYITGDLRKSIHVQQLIDAAAVGSNLEYAKYVHEGTGIYGPKKQKIVPKDKQALYWPGLKHPVKSAKGQKPNPFLVRAAKETVIDLSWLAPELAADISERLKENLKNMTIKICG